MLIQEVNTVLPFIHAAERYFSSIEQQKEPEGLKKLRKNAYTKALTIGFPNNKVEEFRYISLQALSQQSFTPISDKAFSNEEYSIVQKKIAPSSLVFVNGVFSKELSDNSLLENSGIICLPFVEAFRTYGALLTSHYTKMITLEKNPFVLLNLALHSNAYIFVIPQKKKVDVPIHIVHCITKECTIALPRFLFIFEKGSSAEYSIETISTTDEKNIFSHSVFDTIIEENAHVRFIESEKVYSKGYSFVSCRATLKKNCSFSSKHFVQAANSRRDIRVWLTGENSEVHLSGLSVLDYTMQADTNVLVEHEAPHCHSLQLFKGIMAGSAKSCFQGKIFVQKIAQKTEAYQLNRNLLLSPTAQSFSVPNLEIFTDDVKASHGSATGEIDREQLFYMRARGISKKEAMHALIVSFGEEVISKFPKKMQKEIRDTVSQLALFNEEKKYV